MSYLQDENKVGKLFLWKIGFKKIKAEIVFRTSLPSKG